MNSSLQQRLENLPELRSDDSLCPRCKICDSTTNLFDSVDFFKHCSGDPYRFGLSGIGISYYRCGQCSFIFTNFIDEWSSDEVARYIYNADYVKVDPQYNGARALSVASDLARHLAGCEQLRILDFGSGSGVFAEEMRRRGFQSVESYDPYASPEEPSGTFDLITCFEVIEHSPQPLSMLTQMGKRLACDGAILIGQTLQPSNIDDIGGRWWYLAPRNGHVSFFAEETFITLANRANLVYRRGPGFFIFSKESGRPLAKVVLDAEGPLHLCSLGAPRSESSAPEWQGLEVKWPNIQFRWSTHSQIFWPQCELRAGINLIQIAFLFTIQEGFAEQCTIAVDGEKLVTRVEGRKIISEIAVSKVRFSNVALLTPPSLSPFELSGVPDRRKLGIAVRCR